MELLERMRDSSRMLASYAVPIGGRLARAHQEPEDDTRFPFQRDRDRIIHTQAFRRLQGKTQVFIAGDGDHYRSRLTHTLEVAQIGRDIARTLRLNEDLAESIALAHDLGHPPYGHAGEDALNRWMKKHGSSFEHNEQSLRVVTKLEEHSSHAPGLNLNEEILEGLMKHSRNRKHALSLEAQIVNLSDEIAYTGHDCDDGLRAGFFTLQDLTDVPLAADACVQAHKRGTSVRGAIIHLLVRDLYADTRDRLQALSIETLVDVYDARRAIAGFSAKRRKELALLRSFLWDRVYRQDELRAKQEHGQEIVLRLCDHYLEHPTEKIRDLQKRTGSTLVDAVKDYVAGMTDEYARRQAERLKLM
ncbi:MAG: dGTPase [Candidatus Peregrinibacteria bacterium Greene0416_19]|nr:MAG: dGTPase [Candidatus Peregrinibacteria bacterium Greene0416_19]